MNQQPEGNAAPDYVWGQSCEETRRLMLQSQILRPITARLLACAQIREGMRVLDLGVQAPETFRCWRRNWWGRPVLLWVSTAIRILWRWPRNGTGSGTEMGFFSNSVCGTSDPERFGPERYGADRTLRCRNWESTSFIIYATRSRRCGAPPSYLSRRRAGVSRDCRGCRSPVES